MDLGLPLELLPADATSQQYWDHCKHVISRSMDVCNEGAWVFLNNGDVSLAFPAEIRSDSILCSQSVSPGRILKILAKFNGSSVSPGHAIVVVQVFSLLPDRHPTLNMPVIMPCGQTMVVPPVVSVMFAVVCAKRCLTDKSIEGYLIPF